MDRRGFINLTGRVGLGLAWPLGFADLVRGDDKGKPEGYPGPYYIVFNASGGWDTTYLMDPKGVGGINRLYKEGEILSTGRLKYAPIAKHAEKGMTNEAFFEKYASELTVFNGLDLSVNNHTPCARYMATGKLDSLAYPTFPALAAACLGADAPLAFLTFGNYSATGNLVPMSRVPYLHSLSLLAKADAVEGGSSLYHEEFASRRIEETLEKRYRSEVSEVALPRVERSRDMLYAAQVNSKALRRVVPFIPKNASRERLPSQADIALAAFKAGVCVSANLSIGQFDSHNNNDKDQMKLIPEFLAGVDYVLRKAEELKIRDKLVVVMQSEMGRTPNYNNGNGKDHWSIGSIMFVGAGIKGNRLLGATDEKQFLVPIRPRTLELATGKEPTDGVRVRPEHIHQALREHAGIQDHPLAKRFPLGVKEEEKLVKFWG